jgi:hypothetical protein
VPRIADLNLPFGGTWTYELAPDPQGTALTNMNPMTATGAATASAM